ncbi:MAG: hypothetical protein IH985_00890, partial [Planctomycetes bacterium]|nr:hypothetical protein [Planctomycetota bacterium]
MTSEYHQLWGDCHTHSDWSDGLYPVAEQTKFFAAFGNDFRFQTDHMFVVVPDGRPCEKGLHSTDWPRYIEDCRAGTTDTHLCIPAVELGWRFGPSGKAPGVWFDTKLYPDGGAVPDESFFRDKSWPEALAAAKEAGYGVVVAHVDQGAPLDKLTGEETCGIEMRADIEETRS